MALLVESAIVLRPGNTSFNQGKQQMERPGSKRHTSTVGNVWIPRLTELMVVDHDGDNGVCDSIPRQYLHLNMHIFLPMPE